MRHMTGTANEVLQLHEEFLNLAKSCKVRDLPKKHPINPDRAIATTPSGVEFEFDPTGRMSWRHAAEHSFVFAAEKAGVITNAERVYRLGIEGHTTLWEAACYAGVTVEEMVNLLGDLILDWDCTVGNWRSIGQLAKDNKEKAI